MRSPDDFTPGCWICDPDAVYDGEEACAACFTDALDNPVAGNDDGIALNVVHLEESS